MRIVLILVNLLLAVWLLAVGPGVSRAAKPKRR